MVRVVVNNTDSDESSKKETNSYQDEQDMIRTQKNRKINNAKNSIAVIKNSRMANDVNQMQVAQFKTGNEKTSQFGSTYS